MSLAVFYVRLDARDHVAASERIADLDVLHEVDRLPGVVLGVEVVRRDVEERLVRDALLRRMLAAELLAKVCEASKAQVGTLHAGKSLRIVLDESLRLVEETPHLGEIVVREEAELAHRREPADERVLFAAATVEQLPRLQHLSAGRAVVARHEVLDHARRILERILQHLAQKVKLQLVHVGLVEILLLDEEALHAVLGIEAVLLRNVELARKRIALQLVVDDGVFPDVEVLRVVLPRDHLVVHELVLGREDARRHVLRGVAETHDYVLRRHNAVRRHRLREVVGERREQEVGMLRRRLFDRGIHEVEHQPRMSALRALRLARLARAEPHGSVVLRNVVDARRGKPLRRRVRLALRDVVLQTLCELVREPRTRQAELPLVIAADAHPFPERIPLRMILAVLLER